MSEPNGSRVLELEVMIDPSTMQVEAVKSSCLSVLGEGLLTELLVGRSVEHDMEDVERAIDGHFFSPKRRAVIAALQDLGRNCDEFRKTKLDERSMPVTTHQDQWRLVNSKNRKG